MFLRSKFGYLLLLVLLLNLDFGFQDNSSTEEESETLLSALTEMLDSVEDDDRTMSPFDTLPDTKLLTYPEPRDNSGVGAHSGTRKTGQK